MRLTLDLFDYGKPVDVQAPPDDELVELPDFGDIAGGAFKNPFEGAECYGERLDPCMLPNPEVDAMAQDPALCQHWDVRLCIVPMGYVRTDVIQAVVDFHKETKGIEVVVLPSIPLTEAEIDRGTSGAVTLTLHELMANTYITTGTASTFVGISSIEQHSESGGWWFGQRRVRSGFSEQHGMFSYFRMANVEPYSGEPITDALVQERVTKYVARYTALLLLDYPYTEDINYLNYYEMYGFRDLDSMQLNWPEGDPPCLGFRELVCVIPDGIYTNEAFVVDVIAAAERVTRETGVRVEVRADALNQKYEPSKPDWGREYIEDLNTIIRSRYHYPHFPIVGVTDDAIAQDASVAPRIDQPEALAKMSVVSAFGAGKPQTPEHRERLYRLILRGVLVAKFQMELNDDPDSLMYRGITSPEQLDGKVIPAIPR